MSEINLKLDLSKDGYYLIPAEATEYGDVQFVATDEEVPYTKLRESVGGYIELFELAQNGMRWEKGGMFGHTKHANGAVAHMWLNEEGKLIGMAPNLLATEMARLCFLPPQDYIAGPVIIVCGKAKEQPERFEEEDEG